MANRLEVAVDHFRCEEVLVPLRPERLKQPQAAQVGRFRYPAELPRLVY